MTPSRTAAPTRPPLLFLDIEASSLDPRSWPIEVGWAWIEAGRVRTRSAIIAPRADWPLSAWRAAAVAVHGLPLCAVLAGAPAGEVAARTDVFARFEVVSDNPVWDQRWLDRLREGRRRIDVRPLRAAVAERLHDLEASEFARTLLREPAPHRAGPDAARLAAAWRAAERAFAA